jgi:PPOX class probable F420-dependent enzyme
MPVLSDDFRKFLGERRFAVLATINADGTPQQSVVWYELRGDRIVLNTRVGRLKERNLRRDPRISLCVEDQYMALSIKGRATLDYDPETSQADIKALAILNHGPEKGEQKSRDVYSMQKRVTVNIDIEKIIPYGF